jgi:ADP-heptose:LPS heptosyltransferase
MKILVVSLAGIGDTLIATPLIRELRAIYPTAVIDVFVMWAGSRDALEGNPCVNTVYFKNLLKSSKVEVMKFLWNLRRNKYDASINAHPQAKLEYRIVARIIGARKRISHNYHHSEWFSRLLGDHTIPQDYERHSVENTLDLLRFLDVKPVLPTHQYDLFLSPAELAWADAFFAERKLAGRRRFALHVGSGGTKNLALRRWPLENYIALIQRLNRTHPELAILLFGGPEEEKDHAQILAQTSREQVFEV